jgi:hypothetical protein
MTTKITKSTTDEIPVVDINFTAVQTITYRVLEDFDKIAKYLREWEGLDDGKELEVNDIIKELIASGFENMSIAFYVILMTREIYRGATPQ